MIYDPMKYGTQEEENSPKTTPTQNAPFRRVREETVYVDPRLQDNSFDAKVSATQNHHHEPPH